MRVSSICAAMVIAGALADARDAATPGRHKDWNDVDEVEIIKPFQLSAYRGLLILPFDKQDVKLPPETENTHAETRAALEASDIHFVAEFRKKLQERRKGFPVEAGRAAEPAAGATSAEPSAPQQLILRGKVVKLAAGSKAARMWVGFGAGAAGAGYELELVDQATGEALARFKHEKRAGTGMFGGNNVDVMTRSIREVASDIAKSLDAF